MRVVGRLVLVIVVLGLGLGVRAVAASEADEIVRRMKAALEPEQPSVRRLTLRTSSPFRSAAVRFIAGQARKGTPDGARVVTLILAPEGPSGIAWLVQEAPDQTVQWLWTPSVGRVRKLVPLPGYEAFLESDFTYADLGLVDLKASHRLLGDDTLDGHSVQKVETVPAAGWFYSRIVSWIDRANHLPRKREYYDPAGALWKIETLDRVTDVQGIPTGLHRRMENVQEKTSTDIEMTGVRYGVDIPDALFDVRQLPKAAAAPLWQTLAPE